jgi:hypothetical protein
VLLYSGSTTRIASQSIRPVLVQLDAIHDCDEFDAIARAFTSTNKRLCTVTEMERVQVSISHADRARQLAEDIDSCAFARALVRRTSQPFVPTTPLDRRGLHTGRSTRRT